MKIKLGAIFGDRNEPIFTSLNNLENYPEFENEIEELLGRYSYIDEKNYQGAVNLMLTNLKRLLEKYEEEKRKIESDKKTRKRAIAPAEISDETDLPLFTSIMEKFSEVISVEDNKNGWKILEDRIE
ncbi:MAG: hypothetical protein LBQ59_01295 [Candidatus Peribacteria bacterium]|nr:hypothetical protein [Candidatus Peribacteria bacterium]